MQPTIFIFGPYRADWQKGKLEFDYTIEFSDAEPLRFTERIELPRNILPSAESRGATAIDLVLQNLSLILGISYYKLYVPPKIQLTQSLTKEQAEFWNIVYRKGLGEFWYRNNLDPAMFPGFSAASAGGQDFGDLARGAGLPSYSLAKQGEQPKKIRSQKVGRLEASMKALVGIGGGKDSIVVAELLKQEGIDVTAFAVETERGSTIVDDVIGALEIPALRIRRFLDPQLFQKHPDSYNGHVPVSAVYAWLGALVAGLQNFRWVVVGNEYSSDFGNLEYKGEAINHQWSKSSEFERLFQEYVRRYITPEVQYFSLLRPFHEIRITEQLTQLPIWEKIKNRFSSCNRNFLHHPTSPRLRGAGGLKWCGECPKCAFAFAMLAAFVPKKELIEIFGKNLFADERLVSLYNDLMGWGGLKPFDCVGTFEETQAALVLAARNGYQGELVVRHFLPRIEEVRTANLLRAQRAPSVPHRFRFVGMKNALILGYGREGKVTEKFLKKYYPKIEIGIADEKQDENYLRKQTSYDIAIRTPGIPMNAVTCHYTTATNIFFSRVRNTTVGVTGSKGKSTTASLIHEILKAGGKDVVLLGNIGTPMLSALLEDIPEGRMFVLELSSQQLEDIAFSPVVAVVTNLFPEHMDYHGSVEAYYSAKENIIRFQKPGDVFIYDSDHPQLAEWAQKAPGRALPFTDTLPVPDGKIPLLGKHNVRNAQAAVTVARYFGVAPDATADAISNFKGLPHRLELVGEFRGLRFYDDAISTAPESTIAAIRSIPRVGTIFLGGKDRGYDFAELIRVLRQAGIRNVVLFPDNGARIKTLLPSETRTLETDSMEEGVKFAYEATAPGEAVLLSTASPSYSLWTNFEEQGNEFQKWAKTLG